MVRFSAPAAATCFCSFSPSAGHPTLPSSPTRPSSDLLLAQRLGPVAWAKSASIARWAGRFLKAIAQQEPQHCDFDGLEEPPGRSEEHTPELQSRLHLVCRLLLEKKKPTTLAMQQTPLH